MDRQLIDYLPSAYKDIKEFRELFSAEQTECECLWNECDKVLNNQFVDNCDIDGIRRWERIYNIQSKPTDNLQDRRFKVLMKTSEKIPYTQVALENQLSIICGEDGYSIEMSDFILNVKVSSKARNNFDDVDKLLRKMVPANIVVNLELIYNNYSTLCKFTYQQLSRFTYEQLRNEVL